LRDGLRLLKEREELKQLRLAELRKRNRRGCRPSRTRPIRAEQDVGDIWDYIAGDGIEAADRVLDALEKALYKLAKNPGIGHVREELADRHHRFFLVCSYLIVYRIETQPLQVLRVLHGARDVQSILGLTSESGDV
jgi:plasmid stabilization system protein ParE